MLDLLAALTAVASIVLAVRLIRAERRELDRELGDVIELDTYRKERP